MSMYNELTAVLRCPRCATQSRMTVDLYFGLRDLRPYQLGDTYQWVEGKSVKNGGRPPAGHLDGEGYVVCPACEKDFFVIVSVRADMIEAVEPDPRKKPLIAE